MTEFERWLEKVEDNEIKNEGYRTIPYWTN